jgi:hypothetical protein
MGFQTRKQSNGDKRTVTPLSTAIEKLSTRRIFLAFFYGIQIFVHFFFKRFKDVIHASAYAKNALSVRPVRPSITSFALDLAAIYRRTNKVFDTLCNTSIKAERIFIQLNKTLCHHSSLHTLTFNFLRSTWRMLKLVMTSLPIALPSISSHRNYTCRHLSMIVLTTRPSSLSRP